jgi:hypothetical protein
MSFRDDRDALLARADAAEAEVERLREDNARLERELARAKGEPEPEPDPEPEPEPDTGAPPAARLIDEALVPPAAEWAGLGAMFVCLAVATLVAYRLYGDGWALLVIASIGTALGYMVSVVIREVSRAGQRAWVDSLAAPLPREAYTALLGVARANRRIRLRLWIPSLSAVQRQGAIDAIRRVVPGTEVRWVADRLDLTSPTLHTRRRTKHGAVHVNEPIHAWFRRAIERALLPALGGAKIERAEISG